MSLQYLYLQVILFIIYYINVYILSIKYIQYKICIIYYYICYIFLEVLRDNLVVICGVYVPVCLCPGECSVLCHTTGSERHEFVPGRDRVRISSAKAAHRDRDKPQWTKPLAELWVCAVGFTGDSSVLQQGWLLPCQPSSGMCACCLDFDMYI